MKVHQTNVWSPLQTHPHSALSESEPSWGPSPWLQTGIYSETIKAQFKHLQ